MLAFVAIAFGALFVVRFVRFERKNPANAYEAIVGGGSNTDNEDGTDMSIEEILEMERLDREAYGTPAN